MTEMLTDLRFCHLVGVTDTDDFYRDLLGMNVVLDQRISGESFDAALNSARAASWATTLRSDSYVVEASGSDPPPATTIRPGSPIALPKKVA